MSKVSFANSNNPLITLSAVIYYPPNFNNELKYPTVIVLPTGTGVKEQCAGKYANLISQANFITIAFDRSNQGESGGVLRYLEDPYISVQDCSAVVDYLLTLINVDTNKIGIMGLCVAGGYAISAAINDRRLKAVAGVSMADFGRMLRKGWDGKGDPSQAIELLKMGSDARTSDINTEHEQFPVIPLTRESAPNEELAEAFDYYRTERGQFPTSKGVFLTRSMTQLVTFDSFAFADLFLTQPVLLIAGSKAGTKWMSEELIKQAATKDKKLCIVEGADHIDLYDGEEYVEAAVNELVQFFKKM